MLESTPNEPAFDIRDRNAAVQNVGNNSFTGTVRGGDNIRFIVGNGNSMANTYGGWK